MTANAASLRLLALGSLLLALVTAGLMLDIPGTSGEVRIPRVDMLVGLLSVAAAVYFAAVRLVRRQNLPRGTFWIVLAVAVLLRGAMLTTPPFLSTDIYRYVWDGRVQAAGVNPYRYIPADPVLAPLRDEAVYPNINRADYARTIYPPMAQLVFGAVGWFNGGVGTMRLAMLAFEALGIACLVRLLPLAGVPREHVLIYAWNPLAIVSFAGDGHVDALTVGLLGLALLFRAQHRDGGAGAVLASAALAKFFPLVVAPAFLRGGRLWRPALFGLVVIFGGYAVYVGAGRNVIGFLPSYGQEEGLANGGGIWLLAGIAKLVALPAWAIYVYSIGAAAVLLSIAAAVLRQERPANDAKALCRDTGLLAAAAIVAVSPHYHWYFAWLALPATVAPSRALLWLATIPLLLIVQPIPGDRFVWPALIYVPAALLLLRDRVRGRAARRQHIDRLGDTTCQIPQL